MPRNGRCVSTTPNHCACSDSGSSATSGGGSLSTDGCIYTDEVIIEKGVPFNVRYTGCVEVKTSMKSLDFTTRTQIARECINRVCEAAGLKSARKHRNDKKFTHFISDRPCMKNAGTNVIINVSSRALELINVETNQTIVNHNMPRISFASGGDADTVGFLAYIAKDEDEFRACYVLECIGGQSEDLIVTIGKAFMLRYNAISQKTHQPPDNYNKRSEENEKDYYNDLPDKLPPDLLNEENKTPHMSQQMIEQHRMELLQQHQHQYFQHRQHKHPSQTVTQLNLKKPRDRLSSNLIDLNSPPADQTTSKLNLSSLDLKEAPISCQTLVRDVFDIPPFSLSGEVQRSQLMTEPWFYEAISRPIAENLLISDGDFLVRESQGKCGQYVLTGLQGKTPKHLLLIDPEGLVRTKDRIFDSISHLVKYHWNNSLPIISDETELVLRNPVNRPTTTSSGETS